MTRAQSLAAAFILPCVMLSSDVHRGSKQGQHVLVYLDKAPVAWVTAQILDSSHVMVGLRKHKHMNQRKARHSFQYPHSQVQ